MASKERTLWFITRPERDPKFHVDALKALKDATNDFTVKWQGNRQVHLKYERELINHEVKRKNVSKDGSGGRTWVAMLKTFSYVYTNTQGFLKVTRVGKALLNDTKIRSNIIKQILTLQIPNAYFLSSGFRPKFEQGFKIHPARFLVKLCSQKELDYYLTKEEITFFVLKAKTNNELWEVKEQILEFRFATQEKKQKIKREIAALHDHRERSDKGARDFESAHSDVSHTFMLMCDYTELVEYIRGKYIMVPAESREETLTEIEKFEKRYPFSSRYLLSFERFSEHAGLDIDRYKSSPFGDISPATNNAKNQKKVRQLLAAYPSIGNMSKQEMVRVLNQEFSKKESEKYAEALKEESYSSLNEDFVEGYLNELDNLAFEDKSAEVLRAIGFKVELRPKPTVQDVLTEIEILIHVDEDNILILDAKNYKEKFPLSASLSSHMASEYIPIYDGYEGKNVVGFGYLTATDKWSGERNLEKITNKVKTQSSFENRNIQGAIISASALLGYLDYCLENDISVEDRKYWFSSLFTNASYRSVSQMLYSI